ncbi:DJC76 [Symbiodinium sp. KB8]|nr:DJC76 [Symbiodinium sp. KB8]
MQCGISRDLEITDVYDDLRPDELESHQPMDEDRPILRFQTDVESREAEVELQRWQEGRYVIVRFLDTHFAEEQVNVDVGMIGLVGHFGRCGRHQVPVGPWMRRRVQQAWVHARPLQRTFSSGGWVCDGRDFTGGCRASLTDFHQTTMYNSRFHCSVTGFDLCEACAHDTSLGKVTDASVQADIEALQSASTCKLVGTRLRNLWKRNWLHAIPRYFRHGLLQRVMASLQSCLDHLTQSGRARAILEEEASGRGRGRLASAGTVLHPDPQQSAALRALLQLVSDLVHSILVGVRPGCDIQAPQLFLAGVAAVTASATVGAGSLFAGSRWGNRRKVSCERRQQDVQRDVPIPPESEVGLATSAPVDLYELFGTTKRADEKEIKKKYYDLQKLCHPDVAGPEGEEMCILLNDAWDLLSDEDKRKDYDAQIQLAKPAYLAKMQEVSKDLSPTWKGKRKTLKHHSDYTGVPLSHSKWEKVQPEDRGEKHLDEKMLFVDEWSCICCRNCCDIAPQSFCIQNDNGRANVYMQWGNSEEYLDYAVTSCPVDCIYWVSREELQVLEYVTAEQMVEDKGALPCPLSARQGMAKEPLWDPFSAANSFTAKLADEERRRQMLSESAGESIDAWTQRMKEVFDRLPMKLRMNAEGQTALLGPDQSDRSGQTALQLLQKTITLGSSMDEVSNAEQCTQLLRRHGAEPCASEPACGLPEVMASLEARRPWGS